MRSINTVVLPERIDKAKAITRQEWCNNRPIKDEHARFSDESCTLCSLANCVFLRRPLRSNAFRLNSSHHQRLRGLIRVKYLPLGVNGELLGTVEKSRRLQGHPRPRIDPRSRTGLV
jgi:hypothetical protein